MIVLGQYTNLPDLPLRLPHKSARNAGFLIQFFKVQMCKKYGSLEDNKELQLYLIIHLQKFESFIRFVG